MGIERRYAYYYAVIDLDTNMCMEVQDTSDYIVRPDYIPIDEPNGEYVFKYYINGAWYEDENGLIPWNP